MRRRKHSTAGALILTGKHGAKFMKVKKSVEDGVLRGGAGVFACDRAAEPLAWRNTGYVDANLQG